MTMSDRIAVMNHGRYEQLGDPEVLYERPRTRFVAGFLGVSNLLPAKADGRDNGYAAFRLGDGSAVRVPAAVVHDRSGDMALGVRPENLRDVVRGVLGCGPHRPVGVGGCQSLLPHQRLCHLHEQLGT